MAAGNRLVWYLPYVFVDAGQAVASGREVYGYPKQIGFFEDDYPDKLENGGKTTVGAAAIDQFGVDAKAIPLPMLSAERISQAGGPAAGRREVLQAARAVHHWARHQRQVAIRSCGLGRLERSRRSALRRRVRDGLPPSRRGPAGACSTACSAEDEIESAGALVGEMVENPTLVFLKQFRDVSCPTKACYQAIVEAPLAIHLSRATYKALDERAFKLTVADWDSHPIASDLGLQPGELSPELVFQAEVRLRHPARPRGLAGAHMTGAHG